MSGEPEAESAGASSANIQPIEITNLPEIWRQLLSLLSDQGQGFLSLIGAGRLSRIEEGQAVVQFAAQHETFLGMLDRNGKKELLRDRLSRIVGQPMGIAFEVIPASQPAAAPKDVPSSFSRPAGVLPDKTADVSQSPSPRPTPMTADVVDALRQNDPLIAALIQSLDATIVKVE